MTNLEFYAKDINGLSREISRIKTECSQLGKDFDRELKAFLDSERCKVDRDLDCTFVVNVGFVFNTHERISDSSSSFDNFKSLFENRALHIIDNGIDITNQRLIEKPDDITLTGPQFFMFQNDEF